MISVYLPELIDLSTNMATPAQVFRELAQMSMTRRAVVVDEPRAADLILFTDLHLMNWDWRYKHLLSHPLWSEFPEKCGVYDERDSPWAVAPGAVVSMPANSFDSSAQRAVGYYKLPALREPESIERDLLFSLMASPTHVSRKPLFSLRSSRGVVERVDSFVFFDASSKDFHDRKERFDALLRRSTFVLCPRGGGTSSIRMYEALAAGCIPVVISDEWVPPTGIDWSAAIIRWPEGRTQGLVEELERHEALAETMRHAGREIYARNFAPTVAFDTIVSASFSAVQSAQSMASPWRQRAFFDCGRGIFKQRLRSRALAVRDLGRLQKAKFASSR